MDRRKKGLRTPDALELQAGWYPNIPGHSSPACSSGASKQMGLLASPTSLSTGSEHLVVGTSATGMGHGPAYHRHEAGSMKQVGRPLHWLSSELPACFTTPSAWACLSWCHEQDAGVLALGDGQLAWKQSQQLPGSSQLAC